MKHLHVAAAVTATAALALSPLASASAAPSPAADSTVEATASLLAAAVVSESYARHGFHSLLRTGVPKSYEFSTEAWTIGYSGEAAVRTRSRGPDIGNGPTISHGSYADWSPNYGVPLTAWTQISPALKADRLVMRKLPAGAKYATGRPPVTPRWSAPEYSFTAEQVNSSLSSAEMLPWNVAELIATCGDSDEFHSVTCDGAVETVSGKEKIWRFSVVQDYSGDSWTTNITARSDSRGILNRVEYRDPDSSVKSVSTAEVGDVLEVPMPNLRKGNTITSKLLTRTAAATAASQIAKSFRKTVKSLLAEAGKQVSVKNVRWAYDRMQREGDWWVPVSNQWVNGHFGGTGKNWYEYGPEASDGMTVSVRYALITVKGGKMITTFSNSPVNGDTAFLTAASSTTPSEPTTPLSPPWSAPAR